MTSGGAGAVSREDVRFIEERAINAWPALQTIEHDGWLLRFAAGYTRRSNAVNPLRPPTGPVRERIRLCEEIYASRGLAPIFKLHPAVEPADLDAVLEAEGYASTGHSSVHVLDLDTNPPPDPSQPAHEDAEITRSADLTDRWLATFLGLSGVEANHAGTMRRLLTSITAPACYLTIDREGEPVAAGLAIAERAHVGLFDIVTAAHLRNQGLGTRVVTRLLSWGRDNGARRAYLQVMDDNAPALRLYRTLGFAYFYPYWYRVKDPQR